MALALCCTTFGTLWPTLVTSVIDRNNSNLLFFVSPLVFILRWQHGTHLTTFAVVCIKGGLFKDRSQTLPQ